jgi:hypothetical protein
MGLDFVIEDDAERSTAKLTLSADSHWELVELSRELNLRLFVRFHDYYENGRIGEGEIPEFIAELKRLKASSIKSAKLLAIIDDLIVIAIEAKRLVKPICAWAD